MLLAQLKKECLCSIKNCLMEIYPSINFLEFLTTEVPKNNTHGDFSVPLFHIIKEVKLSPQKLVLQISNCLEKFSPLISFKIINTYLNFTFERKIFTKKILLEILEKKELFYSSDVLVNKKIMLEFSSPNTNKPLHVGHIRNNCLGESLSRLLKNTKANVCKVNLINDRGIHICKSMLAYKKLGSNKTPESENIKSDHFVGNYYVLYNQLEKNNPGIEQEAQKILIDWENNKIEVLELWKKMNDWTIEGIKKTYQTSGIIFDKIYFESQTYKSGKKIVIDGLNKGIFFKAEDGSIRLKLPESRKKNEDKNSDDKVFLRSDGTSVYITQDLGTIVKRREEFDFDQHIYVVANEQLNHFEVLFYTLAKLGFEWADKLYHLSYGMVNLPNGKMKSREGTVVDADDLIENLQKMAEKEILEKERKDLVEKDTSLKIALAALHYYLLKVSPSKDILFDPQKSINFTGNTGPYLQYTLVRIFSILQKEEAQKALKENQDFQASLLSNEDEWQIIKTLDDITTVAQRAAQEYSPHLLANRIYDLAKSFNKYYHDYPILTSENATLLVARCFLTKAVQICMKVGFYLLNIPILERM